MKKTNENHTLTTVRLSDTQKVVLTKIIGAATPESALFDISDGRNLVEARNILAKLGLITFTDRDASVTEEGKAVMKDENLIDGSGQLTPEGNQYTQAEQPADLKNKELQGDDPSDDQQGQQGGADLDLGGGEEPADDGLGLGEGSIPLFRQIAQNEFTSRKITEMHKDSSGFSPADLHEIKLAVDGEDDLSDEMYEALYSFVLEHDPTWMPYGTQKARTGDPHEWITDNLEDIYDIISRS